LSRKFDIQIHTTGSSLHLKLKGNFDGSSALRLINLLKTKKPLFSKVFIHTSNLTNVDPFGRDVFKQQFGFKRFDSASFIFTGKNAPDLVLLDSKVA